MNRKTFRSCILLITYCILLVAAIVKIDLIMGFAQSLWTLLAPLFIGVLLAFVLNRPFNFFMRCYTGLFKRKKSSAPCKVLSIATVYLLFFGVMAVIVGFLIPQLSESVSILYQNIGDYAQKLDELLAQAAEFFRLNFVDNGSVEAVLEKIPQYISALVTGIFPHLFNFTYSFIHGILNWAIGLIFSVYLLMDKKALKRRLMHVVEAYTSEKTYMRIKRVARVTCSTFSRFISGQMTEAIILGALCFIGMMIFGFDYALLISVIIAVTSLIPIAGAIIGCIPGAFILLMIDPMEAVWFLVFIIVLQQLEGNLIYPKVVGGSIGLPPLWTLVAIIVGGGLFGVLGMLLGVPAASVVYQLLRRDVHERLDLKKGSVNKS